MIDPTSELAKCEAAKQMPMVIATCDTCGMGVVWIAPEFDRRCIRRNVKTGVKCLGRIVDLPEPVSQGPVQTHWSMMGAK